MDKLVQELLEQRNGRFKSWTLQRRVGSGYSGVVFEGVDATGKSAAIKVYNPDFVAKDLLSGKQNHLDRLKRQLKLRRHDCPYLVQIEEGGAWRSPSGTDTYYYLAMAFIDGIVLSDYQRHPPRYRLAPLVAQVATAIEFLESRGIVHRDVKPPNILLTYDYRRAILLDTGVIGNIDSPTPSSSTASESDFKGTFAYAPPEYIEGEHQQTKDGWKAISFYQLGAVIWELLYGQPIYGQVHNKFRLAKLKAKGPPDLPELPGETEEIRHLRSLATRCLAPKPEERLDKVDWSDFTCERQKKKPTIVFLYAGGTIGSHNRDEAGHGLNEFATSDSEFLEEMSDRVLKEYSLTFQNGQPQSFELLWRVVPPEFQVLSENSNTQVLTALTDAVSDVLSEFSGLPPSSSEDPGAGARASISSPDAIMRYLMGVVVLHGTDTLAYTAAALHFALPHLPCPVVITGSNIPPDHRQSPVAASLVAPRSDAWKNLSRSVHFITSLGHRFCEVFVFFAGTVLHALNVEKLKTSSVPLREEIANRLTAEPFVFRNISTFRSMAFKFIDGSFCNNFYPVAGTTEYTFKRLTGTDTGSESITPHARSWPGIVFSKPTYKFDSSVRQATSSLGQATIDLDGCMVLLLEGFASGTFGSDRRHSFRKTLVELAHRGIPLVVVSADGIFPMQEQYKTEPLEDGKPFPYIILYRTLPATAFALLSLVVGELSEEEWTPPRRPKAPRRELLEYRNELLRSRLSDRIKATIVASSVLGNVLRQREQEKLVERFRSNEDERFVHIEELFRFGASAEQAVSLRDAVKRDPWNLSMRKSDLLGLLYLQAQPYSAMGSMPDMFSTLSYSGFRWIHRITRSLVDDRSGTSGRFLRHADKAEIEARLQAALKLVNHFGKILRLYGWGVKSCRFNMPEDLATYTIDVEIQGRRMLQREDELYGVYNWTERDDQFLRDLPRGIPLEESDQYFADRLKGLYGYDFARQFSPYEWILVGMLRGLSCEVGRVLRIDNWTMECFEVEAFELLRTSSKLRVTSTHQDKLELRIEYTARPN